MAAPFSFALPSVVPQDLQLIQDIIGVVPDPVPSKTAEPPTADSDHEHGTDSDTDSEKEVEADILGGVEDEDTAIAPPSESTSDSDSSSESDSDSEKEDAPETRKVAPKRVDADLDDEDEAGPSDAQVRTKNETVEVDIMVPEISEVGPHDELEKVGEVLSIVDKVVIIKGQPSAIANRGSEKALDCDTLLVFEDRKVLGYIFETFGPTSEPLYQIRFNQKFPLDTEKVQVGRVVYHVPDRSNYVFVRQLQQYKGSDASNVHDEEPGDDEVEFSDDEQEAAHKRAAAHRREQSRGRSVTSSRHTTPVPSRMRDQDMADDPYGGSSYEQPLSYNDMDFGAGPSRPAPIPYDDPYAESYGAAPPPATTQPQDAPVSPPPSTPFEAGRPERGMGRGRGRGGGTRGGVQRREEPGRGRGRDRRQNDRGRGRGRGRGGSSSDGWPARQGPPPTEHEPRVPRPLSPTSLAIARATGQYAEGPPAESPEMYNQMQMQHAGGGGGWGFPQHPMQSYDFGFGHQYPQVQPHINPRFAYNFGMPGMGMGMGMGMNMGYPYGGQPAPYSHDAAGYSVGPPADGSGWGGGGQWSAPSDPPHGQAQGQDGGGKSA
ncbi:NAF1-domain-containing protein [Trametes versicolor FP-101664 SS1]|uniref:NAF1-domain-containing protein n=1 Tax=Trametes versicolor (strain FP-101664) TaxID=717944 RepID=UPI0004621F74|nr:NAF1-domain-containing protein [Trametes versicolor FP-101664 SS1]EIW64159.1 NAF1-domain-containing protein [Trametes versicolor FP-101664 SS1]